MRRLSAPSAARLDAPSYADRSDPAGTRQAEDRQGAVAQWSEQGTHNPWVGGSIPPGPTLIVSFRSRAWTTDLRGGHRREGHGHRGVLRGRRASTSLRGDRARHRVARRATASATKCRGSPTPASSTSCASPRARMSEDPFGDEFSGSLPVDAVTVAVVGWIPTRDRLEEVLAGWEDAMDEARQPVVVGGPPARPRRCPRHRRRAERDATASCTAPRRPCPSSSSERSPSSSSAASRCRCASAPPFAAAAAADDAAAGHHRGVGLRPR